MIWAHFATDIVVIARYGQVTREQLDDSLNRVLMLNKAKVWTVLNDAPVKNKSKRPPRNAA
jgi:hypothetical protein